MTISGMLTIATSLRIGRLCRLVRCLCAAAIVGSVLACDLDCRREGRQEGCVDSSCLAHGGDDSRQSSCGGYHGYEDDRRLRKRFLQRHSHAGSNRRHQHPQGLWLLRLRPIARTAFLWRTMPSSTKPGVAVGSMSDLQTFFAFDPTVPTVIFVHGNQITPGDAKSEGMIRLPPHDQARLRLAANSVCDLLVAVVENRWTAARRARESSPHGPGRISARLADRSDARRNADLDRRLQLRRTNHHRRIACAGRRQLGWVLLLERTRPSESPADERHPHGQRAPLLLAWHRASTTASP